MYTAREPNSIEDIRQGLANLYNPRVLETLDLTETLMNRRVIGAASELSDFLSNALEKLRPAPALAEDSLPSRRYRYLRLRYVEYQRHAHIARELNVSPRQARRIHRDALECLRDVIERRPAVALSGISPPARAPETSISTRDGSPKGGTADKELPFKSELWVVGHQPPESAVNLATVVESIRESCLPMLAARSITLDIDIPQALRPIWYHRVSLRQIVFNVLLHLARSGSSGTVRLEVKQNNEETAIFVLHHPSPGSPTRDRETSEADTDKMLQAAQYLAQLQNSQLSLLETRDAVRWIVLRIPARTSRTIVLVDDNPHIGVMFAYMLEGSPYRLVHVRSADRALRTSHDQPPSAIILDVVMPGRDGWEILTALRQDPATANVPVIVCSVLPDRDLALSLGAADFLDKPVTQDKLLETLNRSCLDHQVEAGRERGP